MNNQQIMGHSRRTNQTEPPKCARTIYRFTGKILVFLLFVACTLINACASTTVDAVAGNEAAPTHSTNGERDTNPNDNHDTIKHFESDCADPNNVSSRYAHDNDYHWLENYCEVCGSSWEAETGYGSSIHKLPHSYSDGKCYCGHYYSYGLCGTCHGTIDEQTCGETLGHVIDSGTMMCKYCATNYNSIKHDDTIAFE